MTITAAPLDSVDVVHMYNDSVGRYQTAPTPVEIRNFADAIVERFHQGLLEAVPEVGRVTRHALALLLMENEASTAGVASFAVIDQWLGDAVRMASLVVMQDFNAEMAQALANRDESIALTEMS